MTTLVEELAELREMPVPALVQRFREQFEKEPRSKSRAWLLRRLAFRAEERRLGGLSTVARRRLEELMASIDLPLDQHDRVVTARIERRRRNGDPEPGTTLTREWHGNSITVRVFESGYEYAGTIFKSLSAVAKAITKTHWNGRLFFGLVKRRAKS